MGGFLVPIAILSSIAAFTVAAGAAAAAAMRPNWWPAAVALAILGAILPMIQAVNIRVVPVFAGRSWPSEAWLRVQVGLVVVGAWLVFAGRMVPLPPVAVLGSFVALIGGAVAAANAVRLFRQPKSAVPTPMLPSPEQAEADALATRLTRLSGRYLLVGLLVGAVTSVWVPPVGRWDLVWAHALLVGSFMTMAAGVCYHVLARWTGRRWTRLPVMRLHVRLVIFGLPVMIGALALGWPVPFAIAGTLQVVALLLFLAAIAPMLPGLSGLTRVAFVAAAAALAVGIGLAVVFAVDPAIGSRLRAVHAQLNLFGWAGLLVSGAGYYLFPRFAGQPLRWPRLARFQVGLLIGGVVLAAGGGVWRAWGGPAWASAPGMALAAASFAAFGAVVAGTFFGARRQSVGATCELTPVRRRAPASLAGGRSA